MPVNAKPENASCYEMTIPYEGGSRFIQVINKPVMKVGRRPGNDIILSERCVSGHHAEIRDLGNGEFEIVDLGSYNGTIVNGRKVQRERIKAGDVIEFGQLRTQIGGSTDPDVAGKLTVTVEELSQEVDRLSVQRDTCRYSLSQLQGEHERLEQAAREAGDAKLREEEILQNLRDQQDEEKKQLESIMSETGRIREERGQLLQQTEAMRQTLAELEERKAQLIQEVRELDGTRKSSMEKTASVSTLKTPDSDGGADSVGLNPLTPRPVG